MTLRRGSVAKNTLASTSPGVVSVHVWSAEVAQHAPHEATLRLELDHEERARADRFHFERDRTQYVVAHGLLRRLLGAYVGRPGSQLRFVAGPYGKPELVTQHQEGGAVSFSLSHSGGRIVIAVADGTAVGVDVERWSDDIVYDELALVCFSPAERTALAGLPADRKQRAFFAAWSRKEAYIKALGVGITSGLEYFDVSLAPGEPARLLDDRLAPGTAAGWAMEDLGFDDGYSGAVVVRAAACAVEHRALTPNAQVVP